MKDLVARLFSEVPIGYAVKMFGTIYYRKDEKTLMGYTKTDKNISICTMLIGKEDSFTAIIKTSDLGYKTVSKTYCDLSLAIAKSAI